MLENLLINFIQVLIGFSGGLAVGGGFVAFITVLKIIPRLLQLTKSYKLIKFYTACVVLGLIMGSYLSFANVNLNQPVLILVVWGLFHGIFNGMLAAALTEVLNVFPVITRRIRLENSLLILLMAIMFGKIVGSLFQWTILVRL
ncbi:MULTISPECIES: stage V sporulation protein AB [Oceanobacillus]|uniref:stage V sporulation protein AB n=1 Tax=Oceanobacillus TaxID=182709 RepID=UPI0006220856|nr:stage V sporulation protein AB [Oceanobacillus caeni]KKE80705.1 stage V sporulation protein AB [Bacilli bacterium VT-13-104]PZD84728.1 stage V sporulation protein AB [Bacilli bacterium]MBU8789774.1 stage V sporulation protein AB [Oceanobacillus caeni]MED4474750.1 stage V sporulation protein AB [Oceanobacillus caeni]PZD85269.1 stage V sporulation protein AB [Bacilli bacterium]